MEDLMEFVLDRILGNGCEGRGNPRQAERITHQWIYVIL